MDGLCNFSKIRKNGNLVSCWSDPDELILCMLGNFTYFFGHQLTIFHSQLFQKIIFRNTIRVSNSLGPDQVQCSVWPDLGPNCLQKLSADDTRYRLSL